MRYFFIYLAVINIIGGILFALDKLFATKHKRRIPEMTLHLCELFGAFPLILILMYTIRHKNAKFKYYIFTWLIAVAWLAVVIYFLTHPR